MLTSKALHRWFVITGLLGSVWGWSAAHPAVAISAELPLIRPFNYDPNDPTAYQRRGGQLSPGGKAWGPIWNQTARSRSSTGIVSIAPPAAHWEDYGRSVHGLPLSLVRWGDQPRPWLIFAAIHGDEPNTNAVAWRLIETLRETPIDGVIVIPVANPDGLALRQRMNARGVDLNRNFPAKNWQPSNTGRYYGGPSAASEPETRALQELIERVQPRGIISLHAITRGKHGNNYDGPGRPLAERLAAENGYPVLPTIGYPTPGSFGAWAGTDLAIPTITLELPADLSGEAAWAENRAALLTLLRQPLPDRSR